jgi:hypothetical protein
MRFLSFEFIGFGPKQKKRRDKAITSLAKATGGLEPPMQLLQSRALPLGDVAGKGAGDGDRTRDFLLGKEMLYH